MQFNTAQEDMRSAYLGGGPGVLISGIVWLAAGITAMAGPANTSLLLFFFGGMLIHPLGILLSKLLGRTGKHQTGNPLSTLALASTFLLFIGLFISYIVYQTQANWFYPIMLMIIGGRYLIFHTIYGLRIYGILGLLLTLTGIGCLVTNQIFHLPAIAGGIIELIFGAIISKQAHTTLNTLP